MLNLPANNRRSRLPPLLELDTSPNPTLPLALHRISEPRDSYSSPILSAQSSSWSRRK